MSGASTDRMLRLAAYVVERAGGCTLDDIRQDVPDYRDLGQTAAERQLHRDRQVLEESLGIVIEWSDTDQRYRIHAPYFTATERAALLAAAAVVGVEGVGEQLGPREIGTALAQDAASVLVQVHPHVVQVRDAYEVRSAVRFRFHGEARQVDPYAVGMWRNRWYVVGFDHVRAEIRKFRLDRIQSESGSDQPAVTIAGPTGSYTVPDDFDAHEQLRMDPNAWGNDPLVVAGVQVPREQLPMLLAEFGGRVERIDNNDATVEIEVRDHQSFIIRLLGFGTSVRLVDPPALVERLRAWIAPQAEGN
jgi:predicted DNA-binding transcriptional regulator YafY